MARTSGARGRGTWAVEVAGGEVDEVAAGEVLVRRVFGERGEEHRERLGGLRRAEQILAADACGLQVGDQFACRLPGPLAVGDDRLSIRAAAPRPACPGLQVLGDAGDTGMAEHAGEARLSHLPHHRVDHLTQRGAKHRVRVGALSLARRGLIAVPRGSHRSSRAEC